MSYTFRTYAPQRNELRENKKKLNKKEMGEGLKKKRKVRNAKVIYEVSKNLV